MNRSEWYEQINGRISDDIEAFYNRFFSEELIRISASIYRLNPCPVCGHKDCATVKDNWAHCYSTGCSFDGSHISAFLNLEESKGVPRVDSLKMVGDFYNIPYPVFKNHEDSLIEIRREKERQIRKIAIFFYHMQLINCTNTYTYKGREYTPLKFQTEIKEHLLSTLEAFKIGFSANTQELKKILFAEGFTDAEIKNANIYAPEGLFVYPQFHEVTHDLLRFNTKNPFEVTAKTGQGMEVIQGFSSGIKVFGFPPWFSWNKDIIVVEGENDAMSIVEAECNIKMTAHGKEYPNVCWLAGNVERDVFKKLRRAKKGIYTFFDRDHAGDEYVSIINEVLPDKSIFEIAFLKTCEKEYDDPDHYYKTARQPISIFTLMEQAKELPTTEFIITNDKNLWTIENRHRKIVYKINRVHNNDIVGDANLFIDGKNKEIVRDKAIQKLPVAFKPFSNYLEAEINKYYNEDVFNRTVDDLIEIYNYSRNRSLIVSALAEAINIADEKDKQSHSIILKEKLGVDAHDMVFKEINSIQNKGFIGKAKSFPMIRLSQYFNVTNNDAYFYYTGIAYDGDSTKKIPHLLRNDGESIRLDLFKRKDDQCLLLIDYKYELPDEVLTAKIDLSECSLTQEWAGKFNRDELGDTDSSPYLIVSEIERYLRKFYFHKDENVYKILALYIYGTYFYELFGQYPYLFINGEKGSGKSILDTAIKLFALNAKCAVNISEAALYRMIAMEGGVIILDELENLANRTRAQDSLMATLLKGGYQRGSKAYRYNSDTNASEGFDVYSPKVISNIFGLEDIVEDRCIRIDTSRITISPDMKLEDPKYYEAEKIDEIREVTSRCCISALRHFKVLHKIYNSSLMQTDNARLTQILTPIMALARMIDISKDKVALDNVTDEDIYTVEGEYLRALLNYYENSILYVKSEIEYGTVEGAVKQILQGIAMELTGLETNKEYTGKDSLPYLDPIEYNKDEGSFMISGIHMKIFVESQVHEDVSTKKIHSLIRTSYGQVALKRKVVDIERCSDTFKKNFTSTKPKISHYIFNIGDVLPKAHKSLFIDRSTRSVKVDPTAPF